MLRLSLGMTKMDGIRNEHIQGTVQVRRFRDKAKENRLRCFGYLQRSDSEYADGGMVRMELPARGH